MPSSVDDREKNSRLQADFATEQVRDKHHERTKDRELRHPRQRYGLIALSLQRLRGQTAGLGYGQVVR